MMAFLSKGELFTPNEIDSLCGWPVLPLDVCKPFISAMPQGYLKLGPEVRRDMLGMSMSLQQSASWAMYVFGNIIRREHL